MAVKTAFSSEDFVALLSLYDLGTYVHSEPVAQGTVQTIFFLHTTRGKFVFKYYENRTLESVLFEVHLLAYLKRRGYPCPAPFRTKRGAWVGVHLDKPYAISEFMEGEPLAEPDARHQQQLIQKAAELHRLTRTYRPRYKAYRWNYGVDLCRTLARAEADRLNTDAAREKRVWLESELDALILPASLPKGVCHCDFHFSNVLFHEDQFAALLDFDDANYTFLLFDLTGLISAGAWPHPAVALDLARARDVVQEYMRHRRLNATERRHLYDVYRLSILVDSLWYFGRGSAADCYERRKLDFLSQLGRDAFFVGLFS